MTIDIKEGKHFYTFDYGPSRGGIGEPEPWYDAGRRLL
jgi:hypothetical protein